LQAYPAEKAGKLLHVVAVLAHRGVATRARENTVEAFCEARRLGADGVELDVRRSADGAVVVHHDAVIAGHGAITSLSVARLPSYVPLLEAAVVACGELLVNIELKELPGEPGWDAGYPLAAMVADFVTERGLIDRVVVSSFELAAVDAVRRVEPGVATAWLTPGGFDQLEALDTVVSRGHAGLHPHHHSITPVLVDAARRAGIALTAWTVDDLADLHRMAGAGVDAIITNRVDLARRVLDDLPRPAG
jgi:glycerophosphoryl diester phosphodiesterase